MVSNQVVGNVGMYYVCYRLSLLGLNVMPTARNARGIDIVVYDDSERFCTVQVKALSKKNAVPLGPDLSRLMGDYWCITVGNRDGELELYVYTLKEIRAMATRPDSNGFYWLGYATFGKKRKKGYNRLEKVVCKRKL